MRGGVGTKGVPRAERERQILDVAGREFGRRGYAHASMDRVATGAGVSKPLVYGYFESKDKLYLACLHRAGGSILDAVTAAQRGTDASRALATLEAIFTALEPRPYDWAVLYDQTLPPGRAVHDEAHAYRRRLADLGADGTRTLLAAAGSTDPADASLVTRIWYSTVSAVISWWLDHPEETAAAMTARCLRLAALLMPGLPDRR